MLCIALYCFGWRVLSTHRGFLYRRRLRSSGLANNRRRETRQKSTEAHALATARFSRARFQNIRLPNLHTEIDIASKIQISIVRFATATNDSMAELSMAVGDHYFLSVVSSTRHAAPVRRSPGVVPPRCGHCAQSDGDKRRRTRRVGKMFVPSLFSPDDRHKLMRLSTAFR